MNVRWYDRILIALGGLVLLAVGALAIIAGGGWLTSLLNTAWSLELSQWLSANWQWTPVIIIGGIVLALLGLVMLVRAFQRGHEPGGKYYTLQSEPDGNVRISVHAIDHLVHKCIDQYGEVVSTKVKIGGQEDSMEITLHMTLHTNVRIPGLVDELRADIKRSLEQSAGVTVQKVQIYIDATKDDKEKDGVRYIESKSKEIEEAPEADPINTASFYTTPVVITEEVAPEPPKVTADEPTVEELKSEIDLGPEAPMPVDLSDNAFPFPEDQAGVPLKIFTEDVPPEQSKKEEEAHE